ncbi:MAG TPA: DUF58 domain-containing protein [Candidatus Nanoarchaeia archaeon]|nr:DUF58 domain-containing protein [Candidatus Nanoarchaeia archaeon]
MITLDFLKHLDKLSLIIRKRIVSNFIGSRQSKATGQGLIFKDHRIYAPGDDYRGIDWRVYGRTDHLYVKKFEEERNLTVHVIIDFSKSMDFGEKIKKSEYASMMGIGFAYMALKNNEKFVISTFSDKLTLFKAKKGRRQLANIINHLNTKTPEGKTDLEASLGRYKKLINSKSLIVIISDFFYDIEQIRNALKKLKRNQLILIQVLDDVEAKLNIEGEFKLKDLEDRSVLRTFISPFLKRNYMTQLHEHDTKIKKVCDEIGAKFFIVDSSTPIYDNFYRMLR